MEQKSKRGSWLSELAGKLLLMNLFLGSLKFVNFPPSSWRHMKMGADSKAGV
jgi:hypothetical protein